MALGGAVGFDIGLYVTLGTKSGWFWFWVILTNGFDADLAGLALDEPAGRTHPHQAPRGRPGSLGDHVRRRNARRASPHHRRRDHRPRDRGRLCILACVTVIDGIRTDTRRYVVGPADEPALVTIVDCSRDGCLEPTLRTVADTTESNNLGSLPPCDPVKG